MNTKTIFTIVLIISAYLICQAIADIGATKMVQVGNIILPGGTFIFALTFTLRDLVHKRLGKDWAIAVIVAAGSMNILQAAYLWFVSRLPSPPFFQYAEGWNAAFAIVPAIAIGSISAEIVSELIDTEIYHYWMTKFKHLPQWSRVLVSNAVSLPIDSAIFAMLAFVLLPGLFGGEALPVLVAWSLVSGQIIYKGLITVVSLPMIYLVKDERLLN